MLLFQYVLYVSINKGPTVMLPFYLHCDCLFLILVCVLDLQISGKWFHPQTGVKVNYPTLTASSVLCSILCFIVGIL